MPRLTEEQTLWQVFRAGSPLKNHLVQPLLIFSKEVTQRNYLPKSHSSNHIGRQHAMMSVPRRRLGRLLVCLRLKMKGE